MKKLNLAGKRFGKLEVISEVKDRRHGYVLWLCKCDCGNFKQIRGSNLVRKNGTSSCGCYVKERAIIYNRLGFGEAAFNRLFNTYTGSAKRRGYGFSLSKDEFRSLTKQNCYYCGSCPAATRVAPDNYGEYIYNGIDRVNNSKGYTIDNVVPCCSICNIAKSTQTKEEFLAWIGRVYKLNLERI